MESKLLGFGCVTGLCANVATRFVNVGLHISSIIGGQMISFSRCQDTGAQCYWPLYESYINHMQQSVMPLNLDYIQYTIKNGLKQMVPNSSCSGLYNNYIIIHIQGITPFFPSSKPNLFITPTLISVTGSGHMRYKKRCL